MCLGGRDTNAVRAAQVGWRLGPRSRAAPTAAKGYPPTYSTPWFAGSCWFSIGFPWNPSSRKEPWHIAYHRTGPASSVQNIHRRVSTYGDVPIEYGSMPVSRRSSRTR